MKTVFFVLGMFIAIYVVFDFIAESNSNSVKSAGEYQVQRATRPEPQEQPQQPLRTEHQQRLAALRQKQEGVALALRIEHDTIDQTLRERGIEGIPEDEHMRVERLIEEKKSIDAAIMEEEARGGSEPEPSRPTLLQTLAHHRVGEVFPLGYWTYRCDSLGWSNLLGNGMSAMGRPNASFAVIYLTMRNDDKSASTPPPLTLVDSDLHEYEPSPKGVLQQDLLSLGTAIDPNASASGSVIFDVPQGGLYYLKVSGGYLSSEDALIDLVK